MNAKIMEGLVGARTNTNLIDTPFRVFKEARHKDDIATMERAMGYVGDFTDKAEEYKAEADKGMKEDAEQAKEREKLEREEAIKKRREEREELEEKLDENQNKDTNKDSVEISEEGKALLEDNMVLNNTGANEIMSETEKEPVIYTKTGEVAHVEQKHFTSFQNSINVVS